MIFKPFHGRLSTSIMALILWLSLPALTLAEVIYFKSGGKIEGKIIEKTDDYVKLEVNKHAVITYKTKEIEAIVGPDDQPLAKTHYDLGIRYIEGKQYNRALMELDKVVKFDPHYKKQVLDRKRFIFESLSVPIKDIPRPTKDELMIYKGVGKELEKLPLIEESSPSVKEGEAEAMRWVAEKHGLTQQEVNDVWLKVAAWKVSRESGVSQTPKKSNILIRQQVPYRAEKRDSLDSRKDFKYAIVTDADIRSRRDPYTRVVTELAKLRKTTLILSFKGKNISTVFPKLRKEKPHFIAFVVRPERIEANFIGEIFEEMTAFNDDPFLDCAFGYITGATAQDALALVRNTAEAETYPDRIPRKFTAVAHTFAENDLYPFAIQQAKQYAGYGYDTAKINPIDDSPEWERKADREIRKLNSSSLVFFVGHGSGDLSCAIPGKKLGSVKLKFAIIVNGTCHSAVTLVRYDSKDRLWTIERTKIDPQDSVCLNLIKAGAIGQFASTASSSWPNVGSAINYFFNEGRSLGEALQESLNAKIRSAGVQKIDILPFREGKRSPQAPGGDKNPGGIQSLSRVILIGDPAYRPFPIKPSPTKTSPVNMKDEVHRLIFEMSNPNPGDPRFAARKKIVKMGHKAVPALIDEMKTSENWQIPMALGSISDPVAIEPLILKLERSHRSPMNKVVAEALRRITGGDFGTDAKAWRSWWESKGQERYKTSNPTNTEDELQRLISEMSGPDPYLTALKKIIKMGREAVPALIDEMKTSENWQIPKALGAIGDPIAIEPLILKLERSHGAQMNIIVAEALGRITGGDFGTDAKAWRSWWESEGYRAFR